MSLFDRARSFLSGRSRRPDEPTNTDAIEYDSFDRLVWGEMLSDAPALDRLGTDLTSKHGYGEDMVRDTFMSLFKNEPRLRERSEMRRTHVPNHAGMGAVHSSTELAEARQVCEMDEYGAAMATTSIVKTVASEVAKYRKQIEEAQKEAEDAESKADDAADEVDRALQQAQQADQQAQQAQQDAQDAQDALDEANEEANSIGGPTVAQAAANGAAQQAQQGAAQAQAQAQAAQQSLQQALDAAQQAAGAAQGAAEQANDTAERASNVMQGAVDEAIKQAADERAEENELLSSYGIGAGQRQSLSYEERASYAQMLHGSRLDEFRKLLGNMRMEFKAAVRTKTVIGRDHVIGITTGGLEDMIEDELTNFVHPALRMQLLQRISTEQALNYDYQGKEQVGDGAIIIAIDNSGSMTLPMGATGYSRDAPCPQAGCPGRITWNYTKDSPKCGRCGHMAHTREAYAKALALALIESAKRAHRDVVCINFSSPPHQPMTEYRFPKGRAPFPELVRFTEEFQNGGTVFEPPILRAMEIIRADFTKDALANADLVFITDDDCRVQQQWVEQHVDPVKREIGVKIWGIAIGSDVRDAGPMSLFCDDVRTITDLYDTSLVADLAKGIEK